MIADVFRVELLLATRRPRYRIACRVYAGWLVLQLSALFLRYYGEADIVSPVVFVDHYIATFLTQQYFLMLLGMPVLVAGAITEEKSRGTLQYLLTTDLSSASIVVGKLLAGMVQGGIVLLMGLPILCFLAPCGAFDLPRLGLLVVATLAPLFAWSAASILVSVWSRQTRRAILALYLLILVGVLAPDGLASLQTALAPYTGPGSSLRPLRAVLIFVYDTFQLLNPSYVLMPAWAVHDSSELGVRLLQSSLAWALLGIACTLLAIARLRPAYCKQLGYTQRRRGRIAGWFRARVTDDPVRWKEQHIEGLAPHPLLRAIPTWVGVMVIAGFTLMSAHKGAGPTVSGPGVLVALLSTLAVAVRCSAAVSGERERQTWEAVLLAPLAIRHLIASKLRGVIAATYPYLAAYAIPAMAVCIYHGDLRSLLVLTVGVFATFIAMQFIGGAGLWASARSNNSWLALLGTLTVGYIGGGLVVLFGLPVTAIAAFYICLFLTPFLVVFDVNFTGPASAVMMVVLCCVGLAAVFLKFTSYFILQAERRVLQERTPYWKSGFNCGYALEQYMQRLGETRHELQESRAAAVPEETLPFAEPVGPPV